MCPGVSWGNKTDPILNAVTEITEQNRDKNPLSKTVHSNIPDYT